MTTPPSPEPPKGHEPPAGLETDPRFPSGPWTGFFLMDHWPGRHQMELRLTFEQGNLSGEGRDRIGEFLVRGQYNLENGKCHWSKRYIGKHDVFYQGYNEGKGIWGIWEIPPSSKGGFHIWPEGMGDPTSPQLAESAETPVEPAAEVEVEVGAGVGAGVGEGLAEPEPVGLSKAAARQAKLMRAAEHERDPCSFLKCASHASFADRGVDRYVDDGRGPGGAGR